jgi:hypothetical protein
MEKGSSGGSLCRVQMVLHATHSANKRRGGKGLVWRPDGRLPSERSALAQTANDFSLSPRRNDTTSLPSTPAKGSVPG